MKIIRNLESLDKEYDGVVLTLGNFDGVHLGHQRLIDLMLERAKEMDGISAVLSFDPHPQAVLSPLSHSCLITTPTEKAELIEKLGVDMLLILNFDPSIARLSPEDFIFYILRNGLGVKEILVGKRFVFGYQRKGDIKYLRKLGKKYGFYIEGVEPVRLDGEVISSSKIREMLLEGDMQGAERLLGRPFSIGGTVITGHKRGKALGFPTANISPPPEKIIPAEGVYLVSVESGGEVFDGLLNIGRNPTFADMDLSLEVYILDFDQDIYGRKLNMLFRERLRRELTFEDSQRLIEQMREDERRAREILSQGSQRVYLKRREFERR